MGSDTQWRDDIEIPAGQPADLETLVNIINNLYALKEEQPLVLGHLARDKRNFSNAKTQVQIEASYKNNGNVGLNKSGVSSAYNVTFTKAFGGPPIVVATSYTAHYVAGTVQIKNVSSSGFSYNYWGQNSGIARGVHYIAIGIKG